MIPHELTEWIVIMQRNKVKDQFGIVTETFTELVTLKTKVTSRRSYENKINEQLLASDVNVFKVRYNRNINETMLIVYYDKIYDIRQVEHVGRTDTNITVERSKLSTSDIVPEEFTVEFSTDENGTSQPSGIATYPKGTIIPYVAIPDDGYAFEKWNIDGVDSSLQLSYIQVVKNSILFASFLKGAFINVLHVFDTPPVNRGDYFYFGDTAKDNDVRVKNVRVGTFAVNTIIAYNFYQVGGQPFNYTIEFISNSVNATLFYSGANNATSKGIQLGIANNMLYIYISNGTTRTTNNVCSILLGIKYLINVNWSGKANEPITITVNGIIYTITQAIEWSGNSAIPVRISHTISGLIGSLIYAKLTNFFEFICNHGQGSVIYDISGNGNNGTITGAVLSTFWGSTADEVEPYDTTLGATLYQNNTDNTIMPICTNLMTDIFGTQLVTNGDYSQAGVGNCVVIIGSPIIKNTNNQLVIDAFVSEAAGGWEHTYAPDTEVDVSFDIISLTGNAWFIENTSDTRISLSVGRFKQRIIIGDLSVLINTFAILCKDGVIATLDNVSIKELEGSTPTEIDGFKRLGYFPAGSGILRGLPNKYEIPTDPQLNAYLPAGDYDYYELYDLPESENIEMTKNDDTISLLKVHA